MEKLPTLPGPAQIVLNYISQGISQDIAAQAAGVSPGYVSQLMKDETFKAHLNTRRSVESTKELDRKNNYDKLEDKILRKLEKSVDFCMDPVKLAGILHRVVTARGRDTGPLATPVERGEVVTITLPRAAALNFTMNINNQVIQAGDKTLVPIQSSLVQRLANENVKEPEDVKLLSERTFGSPKDSQPD